MEKQITAMQARRQFGQILDEVYYQNHDVIIERAGRPMAVLVPLGHYQSWREQRQDVFAMIDDVRQRTAPIPADELDAVIAEAVVAAKAAEVIGA